MRLSFGGIKLFGGGEEEMEPQKLISTVKLTFLLLRAKEQPSQQRPTENVEETNYIITILLFCMSWEWRPRGKDYFKLLWFHQVLWVSEWVWAGQGNGHKCIIARAKVVAQCIGAFFWILRLTELGCPVPVDKEVAAQLDLSEWLRGAWEEGMNDVMIYCTLPPLESFITFIRRFTEEEVKNRPNQNGNSIVTKKEGTGQNLQ